LYILGNALVALGAATGDPAALTEANQCLAQVAVNVTAVTHLRLYAYQVLARLPDEAGSSAAARLAAMEAAAELLPQFAPRSLNRADRERNVGRVASIAAQAAAAACAAGQPSRAVELLEQTRGILVADTLDARSSDLTRLRVRQPALADEFERLRDRLEALNRQDGDTFAAEDSVPGQQDGVGAWWARVRERQEADTAWRQLIERIREAEGFSDFLAPPDVRKLTVHAGAGPVVFVYASGLRGDALILTQDSSAPVRLVPLPGLTGAAAGEQAERLLRAQERTGDNALPPEERIAAQAEILDVLAWTWDLITGPVLDALGLSASPADGEPWPHIWWCPVGLLSYLPLHAAGHHAGAGQADDGQPGRTVLDRVISSYASTLRGLAYSRTQRSDAAGTVIVAVPDAPGTEPLTAAAGEAEDLVRLIPDARVLSRPTRAAVLAAIPQTMVAHLACHGVADWDDPASSELILYDHLTSPLTVADISRLQLVSGLAYLSACETAVTSFSLANEFVHITGAFHLSGYQHVIGTLWRISDTTARDVALDFYRSLTADGTTAPDPARAAVALHHAVRRLRDKYPSTPTLWAAYIHTGS
jgi:hypothetical protein